MKECCFHSQNIRSTYVKIVLQQLHIICNFYIKKNSNHRHRETMVSSYGHLRYGSHQNIPIQNHHQKEVMDTRSTLQHPASASWYELRTSTTSSTAIWIRIRHSTTVSFVKRSSITLSSLAILFCCSPDSGYAGLCYIAWMLHQCDQWLSFTISFVVHSHIFS